MIIEDFCSYEVAKLLKDKGFDEYCWKLYELGDCDIPVLLNGFELSEESSFWNNKYLELYKKEHCYINDICSAPTHQMAMKWLREIHNICITIYPDKEKGYEAVLYDTKDNVEIILQSFGIYGSHIFGDSYEQAAETALKYSLENLI